MDWHLRPMGLLTASSSNTREATHSSNNRDPLVRSRLTHKQRYTGATLSNNNPPTTPGTHNNNNNNPLAWWVPGIM